MKATGVGINLQHTHQWLQAESGIIGITSFIPQAITVINVYDHCNELDLVNR